MKEEKKSSRMGIVRRAITSIFVSALLLGAAYHANSVINSTEPEAERDGATRRSAALVETVVVSKGAFRPQLHVLGTVEAVQDIALSPRVDGQITWIAENFVPGGIVSEGEELVKLDPSDYELLLTMRSSERMEVEASLALESGRQKVALREFELLGEEMDESNQSLVLRKPQLETTRAQLRAAEAAENNARLELERTKVAAPFDAQIISRAVNLGSEVGQGASLARLVGIDEYWVNASVPVRSLRWIDLPEDDMPGSSVRIRHKAAWGDDASREGEVVSLVGLIDTRTRMAQILVSVPDPLALNTSGPKLLLGTIVELDIDGREISDVVRLERALLRQDDTVWVMANAELDIRDVSVAFSDASYVYIDQGLEDGDEVVTTTLATVVDGLALQKADGTGASREENDDDEDSGDWNGRGGNDDDDDDGRRGE